MPTDASIVAAVERAEMRAWSDFFAGCPPEVAARDGVELRRIGDAIALVAPGQPGTLCNRVVGLGTDRPADGRNLDAIHATYRHAGAKVHAIVLTADAEPSDLADRLVARGYDDRFHSAKFWHPGPGVWRADDGPEVREVERGDAEMFGRLVADIFVAPRGDRDWLAAMVGRPGWHAYVAILDGRPVAGAMLWTEGDDAWLGWGGTLPEYRGRGAQSSLYRRRVADAHDAGARWITVDTAIDRPEAPDVSNRNAVRAGFRLMAERHHYLRADDP